MTTPDVAEPRSELRPTAPRERVVAIDVLRGVAVLGILLLNIQSFAMIEAAYVYPPAAHATGGLDAPFAGTEYAAWATIHVLGYGKFLSIFSLLFGAGVVLATRRLDEAGRPSAAVHYRRMLILGLVGLAHAYLLWAGDILFYYALAGCVIYPMRRLPTGTLLAVALAGIAWYGGLMLLSGVGLQISPADVRAATIAGFDPPADLIEAETAAYRGGWLAQERYRAYHAFAAQTSGLMLYLPRTIGIMLLGMVLLRLGILTNERSNRFYLATGLPILLAGLVIEAMAVWAAGVTQWDAILWFFVILRLNDVGSLLVAYGYLCGVMLLCRAALPLLGPLAATGRMAFTNYLMQTVICTTIFFGHGLGWFMQLGRVEQLYAVVGVWIFQLVFSTFWLSRFRYGPLEWLWRWSTYGHRPMLRRR